jgi:hypothetical protein
LFIDLKTLDIIKEINLYILLIAYKRKR